MKANKKIPFTPEFSKMYVGFKPLILLLGAIIIFVSLLSNKPTKHETNSLNSPSPSPTSALYTNPQPTTFNLIASTTLSSGWKRYTVPSHCYSFALPPSLIPIYRTWGTKGTGQYCDDGEVTVNIDSYTSIDFSIAPGGHGFSSPEYLTEEHQVVAKNAYTVTSLMRPGIPHPLETRADPTDEKLLFKLPSISIRSLNQARNGSKEIDTSISSLFYQILTTITVPN